MAHTSDFFNERFLKDGEAGVDGCAGAKRNSITANYHLRPISNLPPELLLNIFSLYKQDIEAEHVGSLGKKGRYGIRPTYRWVSITHVCRHWRTLVFNSPEFWTSVEVSIRHRPWSWVEEVLERSDPLPLSTLAIELSETVDNGESKCLTRFFCNEGIGREIRSLHLYLRRGYHLSAVQPQAFSSSTLRGLETLHLWGDAPSSFCKKLIRFFADSSNTFRLKTLSLRCYAWDTRLFQDSLTSLDLRGSVHLRMTQNELFDVLAPLKCLIHLRLQGAFFHLRFSAVDLAEPTVLSFPQLRSLTLTHDVVEDYDKFLQAASFPPTARITINTRGDHVSPVVNIVSLLDTLSKTLSQIPPSHSIRSLQLGFLKDKGSAYIKLIDSLPSARHLPCLEITTGYMPGDFMSDLDIGLAEFMMKLPTYALSHIELDSQDFDYREAFMYALATLPALESIRLLIRHGHPILVECLNSIFPACSCIRCSDDELDALYLSGEVACRLCPVVTGPYFTRLKNLEYCKVDDERTLVREDISLLRRFLGHCDIVHRVGRVEMRGWGDRTSYPEVERLEAFCYEFVWADT